MAFQKGHKLSGSRKGIPNKRTELMNAIKYVQGTKDPKTNKKRKKLLVHAIEQAYVDNKVLIAILKKFIPDMKELSVVSEWHVKHELSSALKEIITNIYSKK